MLVVVGVEAGKFPAERRTENIRQAVLRLELEHPVVNDRHFRIWRSYAVNAWPTLVLVDPEGYFLGAHAGEITFESFDPVIGQLVQQFDARGLIDRRPLDALRPERLREPSRELSFPGKVLAALDGRLFIADSGHNRLLVVTPDATGTSGEVSAIVGSGKADLADGDFASAAFNHPQGMALDGHVLYVADSENHAIRAVDLHNRAVTTIAGTGEQSRRPIANGMASRVALSSPWDLVIEQHALYIAMAGTHQLCRLDLAAGTLSPYAGNGREDIADGELAVCSLAQPMGLGAADHRLYFADSESSAIRWADLPPARRVQTIVGTGLFDYGDEDGVGDAVRLQHPQGLAAAPNLLYIADTYNDKVKTVDPIGRQTLTLVGEGAGFQDGDTPLFDEPAGLAIAGNRLYVADSGNHDIRVVDLNTRRVTTLRLRFQVD